MIIDIRHNDTFLSTQNKVKYYTPRLALQQLARRRRLHFIPDQLNNPQRHRTYPNYHCNFPCKGYRDYKRQI